MAPTFPWHVAAGLWLLTVSVMIIVQYQAAILAKFRQAKSLILRVQKSSKPVADPLPAVLVDKESDFPADWLTSEKLFQLERRAIFSKTWLHATHVSVFKQPGDFRAFQIAGYSYFVILGKDRRLRAFHNICRHRAYEVCRTSEGRASQLRCRYHGWTYDTAGRLLHAPKFEGLEDFSKRDNGLFEIRCWTDSSGFVYVNFDVYGSDGLTIRAGVPINAKLHMIDSWTVDADFNWKVAMPIGTFQIESIAGRIAIPARLVMALERSRTWRWPTESQLCPLTRLFRSPDGDLFLTISIVPTTAEKCEVLCALYCTGTDAKAASALSAIRQDVIQTIQRLIMLHEDGKLDLNRLDLQALEPFLGEIKAHAKLEQLIGSEVSPASRAREASREFKIADNLCAELEARDCTQRSQSTQGGIDW